MATPPDSSSYRPAAADPDRTDVLPVLDVAAAEARAADEPTVTAPRLQPSEDGDDLTQPRLPTHVVLATEGVLPEADTLRVALQVERLRSTQLAQALEQMRRAARDSAPGAAGDTPPAASQATLEASHAASAAALAAAQASIATLQQQRAALAAELDSLRQIVPPPGQDPELQPLRAELAELRADVAEHAAERAGWRQARDGAFADVQRLGARLAAADGELAEARLKIAALHEARERDSTALAAQQLAIEQLQRHRTAAVAPAALAPECERAPMLVALDGTPPGAYKLGVRTRIGRALDNDLCLESPSVSRQHALLINSPRGVFVEDLQSVNGVYLNRKRIRKARLADGDLLALGAVSFRYSGPALALEPLAESPRDPQPPA